MPYKPKPLYRRFIEDAPPAFGPGKRRQQSAIFIITNGGDFDPGPPRWPAPGFVDTGLS